MNVVFGGLIGGNRNTPGSRLFPRSNAVLHRARGCESHLPTIVRFRHYFRSRVVFRSGVHKSQVEYKRPSRLLLFIAGGPAPTSSPMVEACATWTPCY